MVTVENVKKSFKANTGFLSSGPKTARVLNNISLHIHQGEMLGLVGESGCGKSTLGRAILRLITVDEGRVLFKGEDIYTLKPQRLKALRQKMQIVFQDPYGSLNPRMTVEDLVGAPLDNFQKPGKARRAQEIERALQDVGLPPDCLHKFPHEFSGGQCQRIGIARALISRPEFLVCDEPVSALDVSIRAQVVNLIRSLQQQNNLTCLFISHDLNIVRYISDRVAVMYMGSIVELAETERLYNAPAHPYTKALLGAVPLADPTQRRQKVIISGEPPGPYNPPSGCPFHPRCPHATDICKTHSPKLEKKGKNHSAACHHSLTMRQV